MNTDMVVRSLRAELLIEAAARKAAHKRVLVLRTYSRLAIALTSFFIVCTSIVTVVFADKLSSLGITVLSCATIFAAIYSMIVEFTENSKNYSEKAFCMERSSVAMLRLFDTICTYQMNDPKLPLKRLQEEKNDIISTFGNVYSITDRNYAGWENQTALNDFLPGFSVPENAETKYLRSRYEVFWAYLVFPIAILLLSFGFVLAFAIEGTVF
ncbi:hypothetical protein N9491_06320 [Planktomarina temperata]|nr:hypothetical protein [Planktomarina temperata]